MKREGYAGRKFTIVGADNGGWIIYGPSSVLSEGFVEATRAYGSTEQMIAGLSALLSSPNELFTSAAGSTVTASELEEGFRRVKS